MNSQALFNPRAMDCIIPWNSGRICCVFEYVGGCLKLSKESEIHKHLRDIWNGAGGPLIDTHLSLPPIFLSSRKLEFTFYTASQVVSPLTPHSGVQAEEKRLCSLWTMRKSDPRHPEAVVRGHTALRFRQALLILSWYLACTKMLTPWEGEVNLCMSSLAQTNVLKETWMKNHIDIISKRQEEKEWPETLHGHWRRAGTGGVSSLYKVGWAELGSGKVARRKLLNPWAVWQYSKPPARAEIFLVTYILVWWPSNNF